MPSETTAFLAAPPGPMTSTQVEALSILCAIVVAIWVASAIGAALRSWAR